MKRTSLAEHPCSIARTLDVVGEWWTPLILRDVAYGVRRFREIQDDLQISANVLSDRLEALVVDGILELRPYQERPPRSEYVLTAKGAELVPALLALMQWGDRWQWPKKTGGPLRVVHEECGSEVRVELRCPHCEREVQTDELRVKGRRSSAPPGEHEPGNVTAARLLASADGLRLEA
jgi:DNA-binding HxlR family transcriptional regulator